MDSKNIPLIVGGGIVITALILILEYKRRNEELEEELLESQRNNLKLMIDSIRRAPTISEEIQIQINNLIQKFSTIDKKVANELIQALELFNVGQTENAIEDLVKIMEHLLTIHYKDNADFKAWLKKEKKNKDLHNLLTFCKTENKIDSIEFQFFIAIKTIRNKEDHTLDLNLDKYLNISGLLTGLGGIEKIASIVYSTEIIEPIKLIDRNVQ